MEIDSDALPFASSSKSSDPIPSSIKSQLSTLALRHSKGTTSDPSSLALSNPTLSLPSTLQPNLPTPGGGDSQKKQGSKRGKKEKSARQKKREGKLKDKAVELGGKLEVKVKAREGKKARRDRAKKAWE